MVPSPQPTAIVLTGTYVRMDGFSHYGQISVPWRFIMSPVSGPLFLKVLRILEDFARSWSLRRGGGRKSVIW